MKRHAAARVGALAVAGVGAGFHVPEPAHADPGRARRGNGVIDDRVGEPVQARNQHARNEQQE
jgi:hypothetical protein